MEVAAGSGHTCRRYGAAPGARTRHGAEIVLAAGGVRAAKWYARAAQYVVQCGRRTNRQQRGRGVLNVSALWDRRAGRWANPGDEEGGFANQAEGGSRVIKKRGRIQRG